MSKSGMNLENILLQVRAMPVKMYEWEITIDNVNGKIDSWIFHIVITDAVSGRQASCDRLKHLIEIFPVLVLT